MPLALQIIAWIAMYAFAIGITWKWIKRKRADKNATGTAGVLLVLQCAPFTNLLWAMFMLIDMATDESEDMSYNIPVIRQIRAARKYHLEHSAEVEKVEKEKRLAEQRLRQLLYADYKSTGPEPSQVKESRNVLLYTAPPPFDLNNNNKSYNEYERI